MVLEEEVLEDMVVEWIQKNFSEEVTLEVRSEG